MTVIVENLKTHANGIPVAPPLPNPPPPTDAPPHRANTPSPRPSSPAPKVSRRRLKKSPEGPQLPAGLLDGAVPPINVLIVEDNIINLKLLEAFLKRLKVRWKTAMNGREAVTKWRAGGFHLVLMDIQLPVMNGLDATKEIRRLERLNNIGVLSGSASDMAIFSPDAETPEDGRKPEGDDCLTNRNLFKSPVIIVALTASSLQSDRHEALAAGCNDFLTKVRNSCLFVLSLPIICTWFIRLYQFMFLFFSFFLVWRRRGFVMSVFAPLTTSFLHLISFCK